MSRKFVAMETKTLGDRLKAIRQAKNLTLQELAAIIGSSHGYLSQVERNQKKPGSEILLSLKQHLNVNINWLLTGEGEMFIKNNEDIGPVDDITKKILLLLRDMDKEKKREVLKHIEKEKLLMELLEERRRKDEAG